MKVISIILCALVVFCNVSPVKSVLVKSEIDDEKQYISVYFTEKVLCYSDVEKVCGKNFDLKEEFDHDGMYRQVSYPKLTEIIEDSIGYKHTNMPSSVIFDFYNISNKNQLEILCGYMFNFNNILSDICDEHSVRIKNLDIKYYYFDDITSPYQIYQGRWGWTQGTNKPKRKFEEAVEEFKDLKRKIEVKKKERHDFRKWEEQQFIQNNFPKANIYKGEPSDSSDSE